MNISSHCQVITIDQLTRHHSGLCTFVPREVEIYDNQSLYNYILISLHTIDLYSVSNKSLIYLMVILPLLVSAISL